jgi:polysaccharide export outer membrane protein
MTALKEEFRLRNLKRRGILSRAKQPIALLFAASMIAFTPTSVTAKAPGTKDYVEVAEGIDEDAAGVSRDYRLAPGDRLSILVYEQAQLSGEFIIDGGGGILLPLAGPVTLSGLTLSEAQKLIQDRFADGVLVQPAVSVRITDYRPIFVTGNVRKPGSYHFMIGLSVKAAVAAAGGEGEPIELNFNGAMSDFISAEQRVRELEAEHTFLLMRRARLEAQRDGSDNFVMPMLVGLNGHNVGFDLAYSAENDTFSRLAVLYREQIQALKSQRPRIDSEINAVANQILKQHERLTIVNSHLADLEGLFSKGLLRKDVLVNQRIEKALVEGQISNLEAEVARLRQTIGELDVKLGELKAGFLRQTLSELQDASQRLREVETSLGPARRLLAVKAKGVGGDVDASEYTFRISRNRDGGMITFEAKDETMLSPGDIVEVKLTRGSADSSPSFSTQAIHEPNPNSSVAQRSQPLSR